MFGLPKGYFTYKARKWVFDFSGYKNTVFLAGSGRGGTTWLSNVINYDNAYRYIFEPFHPGYVSEVCHFQIKQYLRPDNRDPKYFRPARQILDGKINGPWVNKYNRKILVLKRLIKDIRTNLMIGWIKSCFPEIPIVLLLRHPLAVVSSQMANGWEADLNVYLNQPDLMQDYLEPYRDLLASTKDRFQALFLEWCIETMVPLLQFENGGIQISFYEHLYMNPEVEIPKLFAFIGHLCDPSFLHIIHEPSMTSRKNSPVLTGKNPVYHWQNFVTEPQKQYCERALQHFNLDHFYGLDPLPNLK